MRHTQPAQLAPAYRQTTEYDSPARVRSRKRLSRSLRVVSRSKDAQPAVVMRPTYCSQRTTATSWQSGSRRCAKRRCRRDHQRAMSDGSSNSRSFARSSRCARILSLVSRRVPSWGTVRSTQAVHQDVPPCPPRTHTVLTERSPSRSHQQARYQQRSAPRFVGVGDGTRSAEGYWASAWMNTSLTSGSSSSTVSIASSCSRRIPTSSPRAWRAWTCIGRPRWS